VQPFEQGDPDRHRTGRVVRRQHQGEQELVEGEDEGEQRRGEDPGGRHGEHHFPQDREPRAPVDDRGPVEVRRHLGEVARQDPQGQGEDPGGVGEDERRVGVDPAQPPHDLEQVAHQADRREHGDREDDEEEGNPAREGEPGDGVGGRGGQPHAEGGACPRDDEAVPQVVREMQGGRAEHGDEVGGREFEFRAGREEVGPHARGRQGHVEDGAEGEDRHPQDTSPVQEKDLPLPAHASSLANRPALT
jgi:hypothetical protein